MALGDLVVPLVIAVVIGVIVLGGMVLLQRRQSVDPSDDDPDEGEAGDGDDALPDAARDNSQTFSVPMRSRVAAWSIHMKAFIAVIVVTMLLAMWVGYQLMRTGSADRYVSAELVYLVCTVVGIAFGVYAKSWTDSQIGYIIPAYANDEGPPRAEAIPFLKDSLRNSGGTTKVTEVARNRFLNLFWRLRLRGEDPRLRQANRPLNEGIKREIPEHGAEIDGGLIDGFVVPTQKDGDKVYLKAGGSADITWRTRDAMSVEESAKWQKRYHRVREKLGAEKADNAQKDRQLRRMQKKLENDEYESREALRKDFETLLNIIGPALGPSPAMNGHGDPDSVVEQAKQGENR